MYSREKDDDCRGEEEHERRDKIRWDDRPERESSACKAPRGDCPPKPMKNGLLEDSDTLMILALIMLLMREKADSKLIFALLMVIM